MPQIGVNLAWENLPSRFGNDHFGSKFVEFLPELLGFKVALDPGQITTAIGNSTGKTVWRVAKTSAGAFGGLLGAKKYQWKRVAVRFLIQLRLVFPAHYWIEFNLRVSNI